MQRRHLVRGIAASTAIAALLVPSVASAMDGTMSFDGSKSKGQGERFANLTYTVGSPTDAASGTTRRARATHSAVCVQRAPTATSPSLFGALVTNEMFKTVQLDLTNGLRLKLTDGAVISYKVANEKDLEEICFIFKTIEVSMKGQNPVTANLASAT
jgi:hypothetical protein